MKVYAIIVKTGGFCDGIFSFLLIFFSLRLFSSNFTLVFIFNGLAHYFSFVTNKMCFMAYTTQLHIYLLSTSIILFSFFYRQYVITNPNPGIFLSQKHVKLFIYCLILLTTIYIPFIIYLNIIPDEKLNHLIQNIRPELLNDKWKYYAIIDYTEFPNSLTESCIMFQNWIVLFYAIYCRRKVNRSLSTISMSLTVRKLHKSLLTVLILQVLFPLSQIVSICMHGSSMIWNKLQTPFFENFLELPISLLCSITPLFTIYFVAPYRHAFKSIFGFGTISPMPVFSITVSSSTPQL